MSLRNQKWDEVAFKGMSDDELVVLARKRNNLALKVLYDRYINLIRYHASKYYAPGVGADDLIQEGRLGLYNSVKDYKIEHPSPFKSFADLCVQRQIITAVKAATRQKHSPLNRYVSVDKPVFEDESERNMYDYIENKNQPTPEVILEDKEMVYEILIKLKDRLSPFEADVLEGQLQRMSYQDIADSLGKKVKSIDNAMQRIRVKLTQIMCEIKESDI